MSSLPLQRREIVDVHMPLQVTERILVALGIEDVLHRMEYLGLTVL